MARLSRNFQHVSCRVGERSFFTFGHRRAFAHAHSVAVRNVLVSTITLEKMRRLPRNQTLKSHLLWSGSLLFLVKFHPVVWLPWQQTENAFAHLVFCTCKWLISPLMLKLGPMYVLITYRKSYMPINLVTLNLTLAH